MKGLTKVFIGCVLSLFLVIPAFAFPVIDFRDGDASGGTITVSATLITGVGIGLDALNVSGTASKNGIYDLSGTIAAPGDADADKTAASLDFSFNRTTKTGTMTITGGVNEQGPPEVNVVPNGTVLLFNGIITALNVTVENTGTFAFTGSGTDEKSRLLLDYLGIDPTLPFSFLSFEIAVNTNNTGSPYTADSTDVNNQGVPEPMSLILLGSGLVGVGVYRRLRKPKG